MKQRARRRVVATAVAVLGALALGALAYAYLAPLYDQTSDALFEVRRLPAEPAAFFRLENETLASVPSTARDVFARAFRDGFADARIPEPDWRAADAVLGERDRAANGRTTRTFEYAGSFYEYRAQVV